jgi:DNA ligase-1
MKTYDTIYSRDNSGNVRIWWIEQENENYRMCSGIQNGEIVRSDWTLAEAKNVGKKNETSPTDQATKEIKARYKNQLETGYHKSIKDIDKAQYVEPILAEKYSDYSDRVNFDEDKWGAQSKYNGICCLATKDGLFSRKGKPFISVPHIQKALEPFFQKYPNSVLHGELFNDEYRQQLNEIVKLCRKTIHISNDDLDKSEKLIRYYIYDGYFPDLDLGENRPYEIRKFWIDGDVIGKYKYTEHVPTIIIDSVETLSNEFQQRLDRGDEGLILRKMDMPYEHKRSKNLLKYKPIDDDEADILDVNEGTGNWAGAAKILTLRWKDKIFDCTFKGDYETAVEFLKNKDTWIGKTITFYFFGFTGLGIPNYAQFDINNCDKGDRE